MDEFDDFETVLASWGAGVDIAEICGGEARTSQLVVRRHLAAGPNFDLVTDVDLAVRR